MPLYRHFPSKNDLIAAYLERSDRESWEWLDREIRRRKEPREKLVVAFEPVAKLATSLRCMGCTFQGRRLSSPDLRHPGRRVALAHKQRILERLADLAGQAGLRAPDRLAAQLLLLMDGAWVANRMFGSHNHAGAVADAARAIIQSHAAAQPGGGRSS
ncbi:MAG: TetR family transcriptional regulator [Candidatus Limnocylindria bacterium]